MDHTELMTKLLAAQEKLREENRQRIARQAEFDDEMRRLHAELRGITSAFCDALLDLTFNTDRPEQETAHG